MENILEMEEYEEISAHGKLMEIAAAIAETKGKEVNIYASPPKAQTSSGFVLFFYEAISELILNSKLGFAEVKVILAICKIAEFGNLISLNQSKLASLLGVDKGNLSRSIKKLIKANVLMKSDLGLFFNPCLIVKGRLNNVDDDLWAQALDLTGQKSQLKKVASKQGKS